MLRRRLPASALLAVLLVVAIGAWSSDDPDYRPASAFTRLHRVPAPAVAVPPPPVTVVTPPPATPSVLRQTGTTDVALTFDDGPGDETLEILGLLRRFHVKATFCLIGVHVQARP